MKSLLIFLLALTTGTGYAQITLGGNVTMGGNMTLGSTGSGPITGGQVTNIPLTISIHPQATLFVRQGVTYLSYDGPTTDPNAGLWKVNSAACESSPSTCTFTAVNHAGQLVNNLGNYETIREIAPNSPDATHELLIVGYAGNSGNCTVAHNQACAVQLLDTVANTYTTIALPGISTGESAACMARDSSGIYYTFSHYHANVFKSTDSVPSAFTLVTSDYTTLPGLTMGDAGNIYTCKVFGNRIYFGGEGGVIGCNLTFTSCAVDYLSTGTTTSPRRNFQMHLADVDDGSVGNATLMVECCRQDAAVPNIVPFGRYASGSWSQLLTPGSGLPAFISFSNFFETTNQTQDTGTARRYYFITYTSAPISQAWLSTTSAGNVYAAYSPAMWPAVSSTYSLLQISVNPASDAKWALFDGTSSAVSVYITP